MIQVRRTTAAVIAAAAVAVAPVTVGVAEAKPSTKSQVRSQVKQVVRDIAIKDRLLARTAISNRVTRLADDSEAVLRASIAEDRAALQDLRAEAREADSTYDARSVRRDLRSFRVELYTQAASVVREAEKLAVVAAEDLEALALIDLAVEQALTVDARSPRSALHAARDYLEQAEAELLEADEPEAEPETEPETETPTEPEPETETPTEPESETPTEPVA